MKQRVDVVQWPSMWQYKGRFGHDKMCIRVVWWNTTKSYSVTSPDASGQMIKVSYRKVSCDYTQYEF